MDSVRPALSGAWILDMDTTIKTLYGRQEGAQVGYNPHKPGRPSHGLHTFMVGNLRLVLEAVLSPGKQHSSRHASQALDRLLGQLGPQGPSLVSGDCGFGNEEIISICESRNVSYLLRLRQTTNVKRLIERLFMRGDWRRATTLSQGWQACEDELRLSGWSKARRVLVLRRRIRHDVALQTKNAQAQMTLMLPDDDVLDNSRLWEYTVLVSNAAHGIETMGQL